MEARHPCYMPAITLRLTVAEKRKFTAEARRRGLTLSEYLRQAGQAEARRIDWQTFFTAMPPVSLPSDAPSDLSSREGFGPSVHSAAASRRPISITDRGEQVAVLANPTLVRPRPRKRVLLPAYVAMMAQPPGNDIQTALDKTRGAR